MTGRASDWWRGAVLAVSGGGLALATFVDVWWVQLLPFVCIAPAFLAARGLPANRCYPAGLCFFGAWLLPTTYWYYTFMPPWLAFLASFGFVLLIANVFWLFALPGSIRLPYAAVLALIVVAWSGFTFARIHLPVTEDWWIPHLGYAVWRNAGVLQVAHVAGEAAVEAVVLLTNAVLAVVTALVWAPMADSRRVEVRPAEGLPGGGQPAEDSSWGGQPAEDSSWGGRPAEVRHPVARPARAGLRAGVAGGVIAVAFLGAVCAANAWASRADSGAAPRAVAVQQMTAGGVDVPATAADVDALERATGAALKRLGPGAPRIAVWPENSLPDGLRGRVVAAARKLNTAIVFHTVEVRGTDRIKHVTVIDNHGNEVLGNTKLHIAPDEVGTGEYSANTATWNGRKIAAFVCYDMHYPDSARRAAGADTVFVPINDAAYGGLEQRFHEADLAVRAVQIGAHIVSGSSDGPTAYIDPHGNVREELPRSYDGVLVVGG